MNNGDITILSILGVIGTAVAYVINKWVIPAYKEMKQEIKDFQDVEKKLLEKIKELEVELATLKERYAEKTVLKSGRFADKRKKNE